MRLLLAMDYRPKAEEIQKQLYAASEKWCVSICQHVTDIWQELSCKSYDLLLLDSGLSGGRGGEALKRLTESLFPCPPRVLYLCQTEERAGLIADCFVPISATAKQLCRLIEILVKKPLPALAMQGRQRLLVLIDSFLEELCMPAGLKGRQYAVWLLGRLTPSPALEQMPVGQWYARCAQAHRTTPTAIERCLRVAVESVFTKGSIQGIERCFGATVDPEKGKPTNRVFLLKAARYLRCQMAAYSLADTRSLNSSEMHQRPAAPTSV